MPDRCYCTVKDVVGYGNLSESDLMSFIRSASDWISANLGDWIPVTATKRYDGTGGIDLDVHPLLAVTTITDDGDTLQSTDYLLYPRNKWHENGPYTRIRIDPEATILNAWTAEEDVVVIAGRWGMYEESVSTGATVSSQTDSAATLAVDDASGIAPGMVLLIDSEQELVLSTSTTTTDSTADTNEAVDATEEEIDVTDGTKVKAGEIIKIDNEQMRVLAVNGNTIVVDRGWAGTKRTTHNTSVSVYVYRTYNVKRAVNGTTAAAHSSDTVYKYIPRWDIHYLCKQMASIMAKKAESAYAGKTGSVDLGEVFYHQEFPKDVVDNISKEIKKVRRHAM